MISFAKFLLFLLPLCAALKKEDIPFVKFFVKEWKGYHSVNIFSCPGQLVIPHLNLLNNEMLMVRYFDVGRPLDIRSLDADQNCRQVYAVDLECPEAVNLIKKLSDEKIFSTFCRSFLFLDGNEDSGWFEEVFKTVLEGIDLTVTSDVVYATKYPIADILGGNINDEQDADFIMYDIWNPGRSQGGSLKFHVLGLFRHDSQKDTQGTAVEVWPMKPRKKFVALTKETPIIRRADLSEITLQCAIVVISRFNDTLEMYLTHHYKPYLDTTHRLHFSVVRVVKDMFKFKLFIHRTNSWGYLPLNSSNFDGMIGMLQRKEIDIGCSPAFYRVERMIAVDYGEHTWGARPMIIFRHPRATGTGKNVFRVPFDDDVWVWMAVVSLVLVIGYALILQQEYVLQYHARTETTVPLNSGKCRIFLQKAADLVVNFVHDLRFIIDSSMLYVGVICQQGAEYAGREKYSGTRFAMVFLFTFSFLMIQFYSASIVGSLLMAPPKNIKTVADLTESSLDVGMQNIVYNYDFFRHTTDEDAKKLYEKKIHILDKKTGNYTESFFPIDEGLRKMQLERFAFHVDIDSVYRLIVEQFDEKDICDLQLIQLLPKQMMGTVTQRGSPYRKILNYGIHRAAETGILTRERSSWITKKPECLRNIQAEDLQVELITLKFVFKLFLFGVLLSLIILCVEIVLGISANRFARFQ